MSRRRFFVPQDAIRDGIANLPPDQAHHLRDVLRLGSGEIVEIFDGAGRGYVGEVDLTGSGISVRNLQSVASKSIQTRLILATALIKPAKFEWTLQKATELGVHEIIPLRTRLSNIEIADGKIPFRLERWDRIVKEAAKQSRRLDTPRIHAPKPFHDFLAVQKSSSCARFLFYEQAADLWRPVQGSRYEEIVLCIGPEGGWEASEIEQARTAGFEIFSLGPWTLRAETAAVAAVSIIQYQIHLLNRTDSR